VRLEFRTQSIERTDPRVTVRCADCGHQGRAHPRQAPGWLCINCRSERQAPEPSSVNWPRLVAQCERLRIPVMRADEQGELHIIRSTQQLREDWE
jgi:hypothetical protein